MSEPSTGKKRLKDLRVTDLKAQLEKRNLATSGVKAALMERLQKRLEEEGYDVKEYDFDDPPHDLDQIVSGEEDCTGSGGDNGHADRKESVRDEGDSDGEKDEVADRKDLDEALQKDTTRDSEKKAESFREKSEESIEENLDKEETLESEKQTVGEKTTRENDNDHHSEEEDGKRVNGAAAENSQEDDSINLMIEDEENLFADETRPSSPPHPETAPVIQPFTSSNTVSLSTKSKASSEDSLMIVNPDESESVTCNKSEPIDSPKGEVKVLIDKKKDEDASSGSESGRKSSSGRNLWISGLASSYRATDLKKVFSKYGKVIGAKVVTNARTPGARCYGYVTMGSYDEATECIRYLNKTELHNRVISVERARSGESGPPKRDAESSSKSLKELSPTNSDKFSKDELKSGPSSTAEKKDDSCQKEDVPSNIERGSRSKSPYRSRSPRRSIPPQHRRLAPGDARHVLRDISPKREDRVTRPGVLTFSQIRDQRERQKEAEDIRRLRERERRRQEEEERRRRDSDRRRRHEEERIERERLELKREREKIEREKAEIMKFERERQRLERERLQREKDELERLKWAQQSRLEDARRALKRSATGSIDDHHHHHRSSDPYYDDRKRDARGGIQSSDRYGSSSSYQSSSRSDDRSRYESSRGGLPSGSRRGDDDYRSSRGSSGPSSSAPSSSSNGRHYSSGWNSSSTSSKSGGGNYPLLGSSGGNSSGGNEWPSRNSGSSSNPSIPRPPILTGISMGVQPFSGGSMSGGGGFSGSYGGSSSNDRYDAYKASVVPKRY